MQCKLPLSFQLCLVLGASLNIEVKNIFQTKVFLCKVQKRVALEILRFLAQQSVKNIAFNKT